MEDMIVKDLATLETIQSKIYEIRGVKVMLDKDLAELYCVGTRDLNKAVKRNIERFPSDFMFQLTKEEFLMFQFGTSKTKQRGGTRKLPYAFTEQGLAMLSGLLNSSIAINVNITIMRAFVAIRQMLYTSNNVNKEIAELRQRVIAIEKGNEETLQAVNDLSEDIQKELDEIYIALSELSRRTNQKDNQEDKLRAPIGFHTYK